MRAALLAAIALALLPGCTSQHDEGAALVDKVGAARLVAEVSPLEIRASYQSFEVPKSSWPESVRELRPRTVRVGHDGVFIRLRSRFVEEEGVFVAFAGAVIDTASGRDPSFRPIAERIYWYKVKG